MSNETKSTTAIKRTTLRHAKIPTIYVMIGLALITLSYFDNLSPLARWKSIFDLSDEVGNIFIELAALTLIYNFFTFVLRRLEKQLQEKQKIISMIFATVRKSLRIIFILIAINIVISMLGPSRHYLRYANDLVNTIIIGSIGWIALQILYTLEAVLHQYMNTFTPDDQNRKKSLYTKMHIIKNITTVVITVITMAAILMSFSAVRNIGISLLASAGFLTAIIGLSAQKTLFSLFSGLQIALAQPIKIGDVVVVDGESGVVEGITFTYVALKLGDSRRLMVPINQFIDKAFENWSHDGHSIRSSIHMHVDYHLPIAALRNELEQILNKSILWDGVAQKLQVSNLNERTVEIRIQISAANAEKLSELRAEVREKLLNFIQTNYPDHIPRTRLMDSNS